VELGRRGKGREKGDNVWDPRVCVWRERVEGVVGIWRVKKWRICWSEQLGTKRIFFLPTLIESQINGQKLKG
jgi:hypothetical protein